MNEIKFMGKQIDTEEWDIGSLVTTNNEETGN